MNKFNRQYLLSIQYGEQKYTESIRQENNEQIEKISYTEGKKELIIRPFFTVKFTVDRGVFTSVNKISLDIYNLSKETRSKIYYDAILHAVVKKNFAFYAGYSNEDLREFDESIIHNKNIKSNIGGMPLIFYGRIIRAYSYRSGVDIITHIEGFDLPEKYEIDISTEFKKGQNQDDIMKYLCESMGVKNYIIDKDFKFILNETLSFGNTKSWDAVETLVNMVNKKVIEFEGENAPLFRLYNNFPNIEILRDNNYIETNSQSLIKINAETGLLSTPIREGAKITFKTLFEPMFRCGGCVELDSRTTETGINGKLKVIGFKHQGTISPRVCENLTTEVTCFIGTLPLKQTKATPKNIERIKEYKQEKTNIEKNEYQSRYEEAEADAAWTAEIARLIEEGIYTVEDLI